MRITVIGGGNIGTLMAAEMLFKGHKVTIYTSKPNRWKSEITVLDPFETVLIKAKIYRVTDRIEDALESAELVLITMPAQTFKSLAKIMEPYVNSRMMVGVIPGSGGAESAFFQIIQKGCTFFGFQRVHSIARLKRYGESVYMLGRKSEIYIGSIPSSKTLEVAPIMESLFDLPCVQMPNYLCVTLTPSNPILHTARLYSMFKDYKPGTIYDKNYLFYEEWDDDSSQILIDCDKELQNICSAIPLDLESVRSLQEHYESYSVPMMTQKINSIAAFKSLLSPMKKSADGWEPDFESRYFTADFSYGIKVIKEIAALFGVPVPYIDKVWYWYEAANPEDANRSFQLNMSKKDFINLYNC